eukprot:jgi/Botrbrau1/12457/Bobra.0169s0005.1
MQNATSACLEVLLDSGCRSPWICAIAADEGKAAFPALAARPGCPCPLWAMPAAACSGNPAVVRNLHQAWMRCTAANPLQRCHFLDDAWVRTSVWKAADLRHASCLEALLHCFGSRQWLLRGLVETAVTCAARGGHVECLDVILRSGLPTFNAWSLAADNIHRACLDYMRLRYSSLLRKYALQIEAGAGRIDMLKALHEQGYAWNGYEPRSAAKSGSVEALEYCLDHVQPWSWIETMEEAMRSRSPGCVQLLVDRGVLQRRGGFDDYDAADDAIKHRSLPCLKIVLGNSGSVPVAKSVYPWFEACEGVELLRCLQLMGVPFHPDTAAHAAAAGRHESLHYALDNGALWDHRIITNAIISGSLECLKCAHLHACKVGGRDAVKALLQEAWVHPAPNVAVLRYVCEHFDADWAQKVVSATAEAIAANISGAQMWMGQAWCWAEYLHHDHGRGARSLSKSRYLWRDSSARAQEQVDWKLVLYVVRTLATPLPAVLEAAVAPRKARAAAFAGVLYRARRLPREGRPVEVARLWDALARLPSELSQRIAAEAHLVLPVLP